MPPKAKPKTTKKKGKKKPPSEWMKHLETVRKANPDKSLGDCMKLAAKSYKKK